MYHIFPDPCPLRINNTRGRSRQHRLAIRAPLQRESVRFSSQMLSIGLDIELHSLSHRKFSYPLGAQRPQEALLRRTGVNDRENESTLHTAPSNVHLFINGSRLVEFVRIITGPRDPIQLVTALIFSLYCTDDLVAGSRAALTPNTATLFSLEISRRVNTGPGKRDEQRGRRGARRGMVFDDGSHIRPCSNFGRRVSVSTSDRPIDADRKDRRRRRASTACSTGRGRARPCVTRSRIVCYKPTVSTLLRPSAQDNVFIN